MSDETKKLYFDIMNSVKGGSGKSTWSFLLASYYSMQPNTKAYVIDLDLKGTSWDHTYGNIFQRTAGESIKSINRLMRSDLSKLSVENIFQTIITNCNEGLQASFVKVCIVDPKENEIVDEMEIDIFERTVYSIIKILCDKHSGDGTGELHIILDMPPSYEEHSENILTHLLLGGESELRKSAEDDENSSAILYKYHVNLFMLSSLSFAHIGANTLYIDRLFSNQKYSSYLQDFISDRRFRIIMLCNDVNKTKSDNLNQTLGELKKKSQELSVNKDLWMMHTLFHSSEHFLIKDIAINDKAGVPLEDESDFKNSIEINKDESDIVTNLINALIEEKKESEKECEKEIV